MTKLVLISLMLALVTMPGINPQTKKVTKKFFPDPDIEINTPAFQKKRGFTDYEELMAFLNERLDKYPEVMEMKFIGTSQKGRKIPMVLLNNKSGESTKLRVWLQGGLHGNEPASTEGILYLLDYLLSNEDYSYLLDRLEIAIVPMANIDGYEKQSRYAANGLDLNRDQTKLAAPESVILKNAFSDYNPEVAVDFHEYRPYRKDFAQLSTYGITNIFDVMFLYSGNLNVPENLRYFTERLFVENCRQQLDSNNLRHHDYFSSTDHLGEIQLNQGSVNARSSATNWALTNTVSTLIEVRGVGLDRTSFKRRVNATFLVGVSYLTTAYENVDKVRAEIEKANNTGGNAIITSKREVRPDSVDVIDLDKNDRMSLKITIRDAWGSTPELTRSRPTAYLILPAYSHLKDKLEILGLEVKTLDQEKEVEVEKYEITEYQQDAMKYEGVNRQEVTSQTSKAKHTFPAGTFIVYLNQSNANMAIEVLEPEAPNSFISFEVLKTEKGAELPVYRYLGQESL